MHAWGAASRRRCSRCTRACMRRRRATRARARALRACSSATRRPAHSLASECCCSTRCSTCCSTSLNMKPLFYSRSSGDIKTLCQCMGLLLYRKGHIKTFRQCIGLLQEWKGGVQHLAMHLRCALGQGGRDHQGDPGGERREHQDSAAGGPAALRAQQRPRRAVRAPSSCSVPSPCMQKLRAVLCCW